jgi:CBS domain-containing protein
MTHSVLTLSPGASLAEAARVLASHGLSGAPVCDAQGHVVGMLSRADLCDAALAEPERAARTVADVMTLEVLTARPADDLSAVGRRMVFEGAHRVVVLDAEDGVVGIVSPLDVLRGLLRPADAQADRNAPRFPSWPPADAGR